MPFSQFFAAGASVTRRRARPDEAAERMRALAEYAILDTPAEPAFDSIVELATQICETGMGAISLVCDDRQWFKAAHGVGFRETPIEQAICAHVIEGSGVFIVADAARHPIFHANELVRGEANLRFYAGIPLHSREGVPIGALCVFDDTARPDGLDPVQARALAVLGKQVETQLELRRAIAVQEARIERERRLSRKLEHAANHDSLTGLPNRANLIRAFERRMTAPLGYDHDPALLLIDVDNLKTINDGFGHTAGDLVLTELANRLRETLGEDALAARVGGDEFAVMLRQCASIDHAAEIAGTLLHAVNLPFFHEGRNLNCRISIGYAAAQDDDFATLHRKADLALSNAKAAGRGCARAFSTTLAGAYDRERQMLERAETALAEGRILPFYQPKVELETGRLIGYEALLRVVTRDGNVELPAAIAAAFDDRELAVAITDCMIEGVLSDLSDALARGIDVGHVAINTTSFDFATGDFADRLLARLALRGIAPSMIEVEVTETVALGSGRDHVRQALVELADAGVRVSLDDFGTGYASLTNVKQLPISALKIDRSFVGGLGNESDDSIVVAMSTLGTRMGLQVIAEGIESAEHVAMLRRFGVRYGQGHLFSKAVSSAHFDELAQMSASGRWAEPAGETPQ
ncbi:putative bifunctional diguanylate cyclase/phosphodiesterase [Novosphingobium sp. JCM 18896]|uniref:putative bifunctional diguanylate cyclase/phosphodiesterase n=1 Tax=Novosphingobium sp. JCM 18896 TaxID=2989731 RepID=UPI00222178E5|nr:EAL domain-containing protein [Novosphingobium sp. JCM 18896]MCW1431792.1 EAL domain-containing protein [Novosphingobium sp. JCM 18896]